MPLVAFLSIVVWLLAAMFQPLAADASTPARPDAAAFLSAPYADDLVAAPNSDAIAWTQLLQGQRSVWVAAAPEFEPRRIAVFEGDDGQKLFTPVFSPDAAYVYFVRGGGANLAGVHPNPASSTTPTEQAIWRASVAGSEAQRVVAGSSPSFNPITGDLVFRAAGQAMTVRADALARGDFSASPLFFARGGVTGLTWSPDGNRALFVSTRGDHNFIGLYDPEQPTIRWIAPELARDMYPAWSPDGRKIAFLRVPGVGREDYENFAVNWPFSVWVHDLDADRSKEVWRAPNAAGSQYEWLRTKPLLWANDSALIFVSEHAGWLHAYRLDLQSDKLLDLTPGECELMQGAVADGRYFAATNCGDRDRRHLWQIDVKSARATALTRGKHIEMSPVPLASGKLLAYSRSTATDPQSIYVMNADGTNARRVSPPAPASLPIDAMTQPESVTFASTSDGATLYGQLFRSNDPKFAGRKRPAVVYLHGGPIRQSVAGWYNIDYYDRFYAMNQYLASKGYVVLAVNYRAGIGYGRDYRLARGIGPQGALEYGDVVGGGEYLRTLKSVDGERIGIYGASYGGYLTALALARNSALFKAGVDVHGVHDWAWHSATFGYAKGAGWAIVGDDAMKLAHDASPAAALDEWRSPILLIHGDDDENVRFGHSIFLANALRERDVLVETLVFPDEIHGLLRYQTWRSLIERSVQFFDDHLR